MRSRMVRTGIVAGGLVVALAGSALSQSDVVADRQALMKDNGANWREAQDKAKAGNVEGIAANAAKIAENASKVAALFPQGSLSDKSNAKPEIWQKWSEFEAAAKNMETWAVKLGEAAKSKDAQATETVMKDFGRQACGTCHTPFRVPPRS